MSKQHQSQSMISTERVCARLSPRLHLTLPVDEMFSQKISAVCMNVSCVVHGEFVPGERVYDSDLGGVVSVIRGVRPTFYFGSRISKCDNCYFACHHICVP